MNADLFFWIAGMITIGTTVFFLKSIQMTIVQLIILISLYIALTDVLILLVGAIQILFSLYIIYRLKLAIDYNYLLVLEKTHAIDLAITKEGGTGESKSF